MTVLDEIFEDPEAKVVVFSQWLRMHELIGAAGWQGSATGATCSSTAACRATSAAHLVDRFNEDPHCRLFLSTDAGGVGLNLQHASAVVINIDLPWNPAVLEQRIGRVHRLGQSRGVQVVNFVAQGTIEEGMLSRAGVQEVAVRRRARRRRERGLPARHAAAKFMESVEQVAGAMGEADADTAAEPPPAAGAAATAGAGVEASPGGEAVAAAATSTSSAPALQAGRAGQADQPAKPRAEETVPGAEAADPWAAILQAGASLLQGLATAREAGGGAPGAAPFAIERDPVTGQASVRLPLPDTAVLQRLARAFEPWLR